MTQYEHTQIGRSIIWVGSGAAVLLAIGAIFEPPSVREVFLVISAVLFITVALFYKLKITIDHKTLRASFGLGLIKREVPVAEIVACEPIRIRWWYGWGIHLTPYGWLYNIAGWEAVAIRLRNGRKFSLGTDDPHGLTATIRRFSFAE